MRMQMVISYLQLNYKITFVLFFLFLFVTNRQPLLSALQNIFRFKFYFYKKKKKKNTILVESSLAACGIKNEVP